MKGKKEGRSSRKRGEEEEEDGKKEEERKSKKKDKKKSPQERRGWINSSVPVLVVPSGNRFSPFLTSQRLDLTITAASRQ